MKTSHAEQASAPKKRGRTRMLVVIKWALLILVCLGTVLLVSYLMARSGMQVEQLNSQVQLLRIWGIGLQFTAIVAIGVFWQQIINWAHKRSLVLTYEYRHMLGLRNKVLAFLLAYLLLIPIGPSTLMSWVFQ